MRGAWLAAVALILLVWAIGSYHLVFTAPPACDQVFCDYIEFSAADVDQMAALGLPARGLHLGWTVFGVVYSLPFFVLASLIYLRRSSGRMGLLVAFTLVNLAGVLFTSSDDAFQRAAPSWTWLLTLIDILGIGAFVLLLLTFPSGVFVRSWTWKLVGALFLLAEVIPLTTTASSRIEQLESPGPLTILWLVLVAVMFGIALYSQIDRYRRISTPRERQQTNWVIFGFAGAIAVVPLWSFIGATLPPSEPSPTRAYVLLAGIPLILLFSSLLPLSLAASILRHRLLDIDVLIHRTLVYSVLSGSLIGAYLLAILVLQRIFPADSQVSVVASTLLIAALFSPLRRWIQSGIDRRFYRRKYDAERTLEGFSATLRDEIGLHELKKELVNVVAETIQPRFVSLWMTAESTLGEANEA